MLTPFAFARIIRYFDGVDRLVSDKLIRPRPWLEPCLTQLLADLIDPSTSGEYALGYTQEALSADLSAHGGAFLVDLKIELNEYSAQFENRVSQADLGLVLRYDDHVRPTHRWEKPFLLQAKRLTPRYSGEHHYTPGSRFDVDGEQVARIERLSELFGRSAVRFLLYCPRPDRLDEDSRRVLHYARSLALSVNIFDYSWGLEVRDQLGARDSTLEAGIFVTKTSSAPATLMRVHERLLAEASPLAWFIAMQFADSRSVRAMRAGRQRPTELDDDDDGAGDADWLMSVIRGREDAVRKLLAALDDSRPLPDGAGRTVAGVLPRYTMTVTVAAVPGLKTDIWVND